MFNIAGLILAGGGGIVWQVIGLHGREPEGLSINFPFSGSPPSARDARRIVARVLTEQADVDWFQVRRSIWQVDLSKLRERFKINFEWLQGTVMVEPDYDILPETFHPENLRGMLRLVFERDALEAAGELPWDEYPEEQTAELVPLLRRRAFDSDIERLFQSEVEGRTSALVMLDIDHFKKVNDTHGHQAGDAVLVRVSEIIRGITGRRGRAYRYGGEEMAILLPDFTAEEALPLVARIRETVQAEAWPNYEGLTVTISAGVAASQSPMTTSLVVKAADQALYAAKHAGRNRIELA